MRSAPGNVRINVMNVNDNAPAITAGQSFDIDDGAHRNVIGALESPDADDINQIGFTTFQGWAIVGGNAGAVLRIAPRPASSRSRVRC